MKVLIISNYKDAYNSVRPEGEIFIGLQKIGFELTIMTQKDAEYIPNFIKAGIKIIDFQPTKKLSWSAIQLIRKTLQSSSFDILHLFNSKAISNGNFAAIGLPVKVLVYRGVIGGSSWLNPNAYLKHLHPRVDGITAVSKSIQKYLQTQIWWKPAKVKQYYKGQNLDWYKAVQPTDKATLGLPEDAFIVSCIANNRRSKGVVYLLSAMDHLPPNLPIHLLLIGRKMDTKKQLAIIEKSPYKNHIHLLGFRNDVASLLKMSQVYIQPTNRNNEGLGKAILEAMSLKTPVIVTDSGGPAEYVEHGISGIIIPSKDPIAIAKAILELYDNQSFSKKLAQNGQAVIATKMSMQQSILSLKRIYESFV